jgi:hypothetical protein
VIDFGIDGLPGKFPFHTECKLQVINIYFECPCRLRSDIHYFKKVKFVQRSRTFTTREDSCKARTIGPL